MSVIPTVIRATYRGDYRIALVFQDGVQAIIDFAQWLDGPVFEPLRDREYFRRFFIDGGTVRARALPRRTRSRTDAELRRLFS